MKDGTVLLGVGKLFNGSISYSYPTGIIADGMPVWVYAEDKQIVASRSLPEQLTCPPAIREIKRYGKKEVRISGARFPFPPYLLNAVGISTGDLVSTGQRGDEIVFSRMDPSLYSKIQPVRKKQRQGVDGEVRGGRVLRFSPQTKAQLGLSRNCWLHMRLNLSEGCWLEISKKKEEVVLPTLRQMRSRNHRNQFLRNGGVEFQMWFRDHINLPVIFLRQAGIMDTTTDTQLPCWISDKGWFILEGMPIQCDSCEKPVGRYREKYITQSACNSCHIKKTIVED